MFDRFCLPFLMAIAVRVKGELRRLNLVVPMIVIAKGAHFALEKLAQAGYDVVGLDWTIDPMLAREKSRSLVCLQGNMDPCALYASPETIESEVRAMLARFGTQKYIANLGHGMHPTHDPESVRIFVDAVHRISTEMNSFIT